MGSWYNDSPFLPKLAGGVYWLLDPVFGDGAVLEPIAVVIDPDETIYEEYIEPIPEETSEVIIDPIIDYVEPLVEDLKEDTVSILKWGAAIGLLYVALK